MKFRIFSLTLLAGLLGLAACAGEPQIVEVTRVVTEQNTVEVPVEVTRLVEQQVTVEVPVEVTRLVELVVTPTAETVAALPTEAVPTATATVLPTLPPGTVYTVLPGDTLSSISDKTDTAVADIMLANNMTNDAIVIAGQELLIPGWDGQSQAGDTAAPPPTADETAPEAVIQGANLFPNPSFEGDWYFYLYNELQIPDGWQLATDEGANELQPGSGGLFNRPEVRVVPAKDLPPAEQSTFIFAGSKTVKAFKGGAPTSFSLFTDVTLQPGTYRLQVRFFPDTVAQYHGGQKTFASDPLAAEVRIIQDGGGTGWQGTQIGQRNTLTYDFTLTEAATVRLGASFRNRYIMANNGWFIDDWSLHALSQ